MIELKNVEFAKGWGKPDNVHATAGLCTSGEVPDDYFVQVQHQLAVMGYEWAFLVVTIAGWITRAFVSSWRFDLWWDTSHNLIAVNASSRKRAEDVLDLLRQTLGSLKVTPLATKTTPTRAMTEWLHNPDKRPAWLDPGN